MKDDIFIPEHKTNILPLRWLANYIFEPISTIFLKLYLKWGTTYVFDEMYIEDFKKSMIGQKWDDYDEYGIPYWDYNWHEDPITGDAWRLIKK